MTGTEAESRAALPEQVLALVVRGHREHALERVPVPQLGAGEALVEVTHVAVCGTDLRLLRGTLHDAEYPVVPGHEWAGRVLAAPTRPELVGRAVVGEGITPCRSCVRCGEGKYNLCHDLDEVGFTRQGAFAEAFSVPAANLRPLPEGLSGAEGCMLEPLCVALHAVERAPAPQGRKVGVIGAGAVGLLVAQLALIGGASSVVVAEPSPHRRQIAGEFGAETVDSIAHWTGDTPPDLVFDATGVAAVFSEGLRATRPGGDYVLVGYSGEESTVFEPSSIMLSEVSVHGVLSGYDQIDRAIELVESGAVRVAPLIGQILPFHDYRKMLDEVEVPPLRTVFVPGRE